MKSRGKKKNTGGVIITVAIFVAIIIILLIFLMQGKTTTSGNYPDNVIDVSLTCISDDIDYPIFTYDNSTQKEAKIDVLFSKDKMRSIALTYSLYYDDTASIVASEAHNHAAMNISFGANQLDADAFSAKYSKLSNRLQMNLYATSSQIDSSNLKYFLINNNDGYIPNVIMDYKTIYEDQGMECKENK